MTTHDEIQRREIIQRLMKHMGWTEQKAIHWYETENPHFGNASAKRMVESGRGDKVLKFINGAVDDDQIRN